MIVKKFVIICIYFMHIKEVYANYRKKLKGIKYFLKVKIINELIRKI